MSESLLQLKKMLGKYAETELLLLSDAAKKLGMSDQYLHDLARRGQIKSFKVGEDLFIEEKWLGDFRVAIKNNLAAAVSEHEQFRSRQSPWVKGLVQKQKTNASPRESGRFKIFLLTFFSDVSPVVVSSVFLAVSILGISLMLAPNLPNGLKQQYIAKNFLTATRAVYYSPLGVFDRLGQPEKIDDEGLTAVIFDLAGAKKPGKVLGQFESRLDIR